MRAQWRLFGVRGGTMDTCWDAEMICHSYSDLAQPPPTRLVSFIIRGDARDS